eukprot:403341272
MASKDQKPLFLQNEDNFKTQAAVAKNSMKHSYRDTNQAATTQNQQSINQIQKSKQNYGENNQSTIFGRSGFFSQRQISRNGTAIHENQNLSTIQRNRSVMSFNSGLDRPMSQQKFQFLNDDIIASSSNHNEGRSVTSHLKSRLNSNISNIFDNKSQNLMKNAVSLLGRDQSYLPLQFSSVTNINNDNDILEQKLANLKSQLTSIYDEIETQKFEQESLQHQLFRYKDQKLHDEYKKKQLVPEQQLVDKLSLNIERVQFLNTQVQKVSRMSVEQCKNKFNNKRSILASQIDIKNEQLQQSNSDKKLIQKNLDLKEDKITKMKNYLDKIKDLNKKIEKKLPSPQELYEMRKKETTLLFNLNSLKLLEEFLDEKDQLIQDQENSGVFEMGQTDLDELSDIIEFQALKNYRAFLYDQEGNQASIHGSPKSLHKGSALINQIKRRTTLIKFPTVMLKKLQTIKQFKFSRQPTILKNGVSTEAIVFKDQHVLSLWKDYKHEQFSEVIIIKNYDVALMRLFSNTNKHKILNQQYIEKLKIKEQLEKTLQRIKYQALGLNENDIQNETLDKEQVYQQLEILEDLQFKNNQTKRNINAVNQLNNKMRSKTLIFSLRFADILSTIKKVSNNDSKIDGQEISLDFDSFIIMFDGKPKILPINMEKVIKRRASNVSDRLGGVTPSPGTHKHQIHSGSNSRRYLQLQKKQTRLSNNIDENNNISVFKDNAEKSEYNLTYNISTSELLHKIRQILSETQLKQSQMRQQFQNYHTQQTKHQSLEDLDPSKQNQLLLPIKKSQTNIGLNLKQNAELQKKIQKELDKFQFLDKDLLIQRQTLDKGNDEILKDTIKEENQHLTQQRSFVKEIKHSRQHSQLLRESGRNSISLMQSQRLNSSQTSRKSYELNQQFMKYHSSIFGLERENTLFASKFQLATKDLYKSLQNQQLDNSENKEILKIIQNVEKKDKKLQQLPQSQRGSSEKIQNNRQSISNEIQNQRSTYNKLLTKSHSNNSLIILEKAEQTYNNLYRSKLNTSLKYLNQVAVQTAQNPHHQQNTSKSLKQSLNGVINRQFQHQSYAIDKSKQSQIYQVPTNILYAGLASTRNSKIFNTNLFNNNRSEAVRGNQTQRLMQSQQSKTRPLNQLDIIKEILSKQEQLQFKRNKSVSKLKDIYQSKSNNQQFLSHN